jgi:hypothetical protein
MQGNSVLRFCGIEEDKLRAVRLGKVDIEARLHELGAGLRDFGGAPVLKMQLVETGRLKPSQRENML